MAEQYDVAIVGAGIVGLANAWAACRRGNRVILFERDHRAIGASIRNFGMIYPIGQPLGIQSTVARQSRKLWLEVAEESGIWLNQCGSLHLAHHDDEWEVLKEFIPVAANDGLHLELLTPEETVRRSPAVNPDGLRGALWSEHEMGVNPAEAISSIPLWLEETFGLKTCFDTTISKCDENLLVASDGRSWEANKTVICSGADTRTLYPHLLAESQLNHCKLQMMRTKPQSTPWLLGPHIAGGLTLRHYPVFSVCKSQKLVQQRVTENNPELNQYGIHVLAAQLPTGEVILGDSHEYGDELHPFEQSHIEELILRELHKIIRLPTWRIGERWHGIYTRSVDGIPYVAAPSHNTRIMTGMGGSGMTSAFGIAEQLWTEWH